MPISPTSNKFDVLKWNGRSLDRQPDELSEEAPLEIRLRHHPITVTMRTPGHDEELAAGFLVTEGVVQSPGDFLKIQHCAFDDTQSTLNVILAPQVKFDIEKLTRHVFASSSCGLCGKATIDAVRTWFPPVRSSAVVDAETILQLPHQMRAAQDTFSRTGGLHAAAIFDNSGTLVVLREDVGRHNAVDKVIGYSLLHGLYPLSDYVLMVSGRCSFEIMLKALAAQLPLIAAVSAPSSLAVEFAHENGQTLIGFVRDRRMNVYTHSHRLKFPRAHDADTTAAAPLD